MKYFIPAIAFVMFLGSCVSTNYMTVEIKEPARVTLPPEIVNIAVVDNSYIPEEQHNEEDTYTQKKDTIEIPTDSARIHLAKSLAQFMEEEKFFNEVTYYPHFKHEYDSVFISLTKDEIADICYETNSDALISVDRCLIEGSLEVIPFYDNFCVMKIGARVVINTYKADGTILHTPILFADTLYWDGLLPGKESSYTFLKPLPSAKEAMMEIATLAADQLTNAFTPYWITVNRKYYSGGSSEMKKASALASEYKWIEAATIWGDQYEKEEKPVKKARMAYNIALANECLGDIANAVNWNNIAIDLLSGMKNSDLQKSVEEQAKILKRRDNQLRKLQEQYGTE